MLVVVHQKLVFGLGAVGIGLIVMACTQDAQRPDLPTTLGNTEPVTIVGADGTSHAALSTAGACEDVGTFTGSALSVKMASNVESATWSAVDRPQPARFTIFASGSASELSNKTVDLATGVNTNFATCSHCFIVAIGCTGSDCSKAAFFYPRSGTAVFTKVASAANQPFEGRLENADLVQVVIDSSSDKSSVVPKGACMHVQTLSFSGTTSSTATSSTSTSSTTSSGASSGGEARLPSSSTSTSGTGSSGGGNEGLGRYNKAGELIAN